VYSYSPITPQGLIVDDDTAILSLVEAALEPDHYQLQLAHDAKEALRLARQSACPLSFVVTDYNIGRDTGLDVAAAIRRIFPSTRVLMISGQAPEGLEDDALVDAFLAKPFSAAELRDKVRELLEHSHSHHALAHQRIA
jgi:two-component system response regulator CpxR